MDETIKNLCDECLQCKKPLCVNGCLVNNNIPLFIKLLKEDKIDEAFKVIDEKSTLPSICSIVCPFEKACMNSCVKSKINKSVKIPLIENYIASHAKNTNKPLPYNDKNVALIGSGPASLACGEKLALLGYRVDIYDKFSEAGGILTYGIPSFVLDKKIVKDKINYLKSLGINFILNKELKKDFTINSLKEKYDAVFIGIGAGKKKKMNIKNEDLENIIDANDYLKENYLNNFDNSLYKNIIVVGGGNTAIDAARVAKRNSNNSNVTIIYRRSENEMPARKNEYENALNDGITFNFLTNPVEFIGENKVSKTKCQKMKLVQSDENRLKPVPIENAFVTLDTDLVILAISSYVDVDVLDEVSLNSWGGVIINEKYQTSIENVFAGGDCISGPLYVATATKDGVNAAKYIDEYLKSSH